MSNSSQENASKQEGSESETAENVNDENNRGTEEEPEPKAETPSEVGDQPEPEEEVLESAASGESTESNFGPTTHGGKTSSSSKTSRKSQNAAPNARSDKIPDAVWGRLRAPFDRSDIRLADIQIDPKHGRGLARPVLSEDALISRLNEVLGPEGWSIEFTTEGSKTCRCRLYIGSAFRDAIAEETNQKMDCCFRAFRLAAREFGIGIGLHGPPRIYVEKDPEGSVTNFDEIVEDLQAIGAVR